MEINDVMAYNMQTIITITEINRERIFRLCLRVKKRAGQKACALKSVRVKKRACQRAYQKLQKQVEDFVDKRINDSSVHSNIVMFDF